LCRDEYEVDETGGCLISSVLRKIAIVLIVVGAVSVVIIGIFIVRCAQKRRLKKLIEYPMLNEQETTMSE